MSASISLSFRRASLPSSHSATTTTTSTSYICQQCRHATLLRRPKRPYTFTQLVTLSDGSTFLHRTTSPAPIYRSTRDVRNSLLWNPTSSKLMNVEDDEAGRLRAFRERFGRSWDAVPTAGAAAAESSKEAKDMIAEDEEQARIEREVQEEEDNLLDLISSFGQENQGGSSGKKKK
ncbi:hypothetical protein VTN31DRAFT_6101 [Thermomyces dupontii]|uniref:mitochondrial 54S ribosomal protein bL31m n=1 Tax=Talaromyces thermophilus TaxID=28565 RepID=UPI0037442052